MAAILLTSLADSYGCIDLGINFLSLCSIKLMLLWHISMFCEYFISYDLLKCHCCHIFCACSAENSPYSSFDNINDHILDINNYNMFNMTSTSCKNILCSTYNSSWSLHHVPWCSPHDHNDLHHMFIISTSPWTYIVHGLFTKYP